MHHFLTRAAAASFAGISIAVGGSPIEWCLFPFLGPAFLAWALEGVRSPLRAALLGALTGVAANALMTSWVVPLLELYAGFPTSLAWLVGSLLFFGQALPWALAGLFTCGLATRVPLWIALPLAIALGGSLAPMLFPWRLASSQIAASSYVQMAELSGQSLIDLSLGFASTGLLFEGLRSRRTLPLGVGALALFAPLLFGIVRLGQLREERRNTPEIRVGVVQANIGVLERFDRTRDRAHLELHRSMTRELEAQNVALTVWPESSYPFLVDRRAFGRAGTARHILGGNVRGPILFGAVSVLRDRHWNSALAVDREGSWSGVYDKIDLLAFGEYTPFWDLLPPLQHFFPRGFDAGLSSEPIRVGGLRIGVLDCYEDLLPQRAREAALREPDVLVNLTNDAWFGPTFAPHLHHMLARMRAIETRRDLLRVVNTGISGLVHSTGEDEHRTRPFERTSFIASVRPSSRTTLFTRFGDWVTPMLGAFVLALAFSQRSSGSLHPRTQGP